MLLRDVLIQIYISSVQLQCLYVDVDLIEVFENEVYNEHHYLII